MLCSVRPLGDRRGNGGFSLTSILIICVVIVIRWRPNIEVCRTLRIVARLLDAGVVCVLDIGMV
jgi:hypothetical protein